MATGCDGGLDMVARFYRPFTNWQLGRPVLVYIPTTGREMEAVLPTLGVDDGEELIKSHLEDLYLTRQDVLNRGTHHIVFVWSNGMVPMVNCWAYGTNPDAASGPRLLMVRVFQMYDIREDPPEGIGTRDTSVVIGAEALLHMSVPGPEYHDRLVHLPPFPPGFVSEKAFGEV